MRYTLSSCNKRATLCSGFFILLVVVNLALTEGSVGSIIELVTKIGNEMAVNTKTKRIPVKWIRDGAKAAYDKKGCCFICDSTDELELHHTHGMTNLLEKWAKDNNVSLGTDEEVLEIRDEFIRLHHKEIYEDVFTLCVQHHRKLHQIFGKSPPLSTSAKQIRWVQIQKDKHNGIISKSEQLESKELVRKTTNFGQEQSSSGDDLSSGGIFSRFIGSHRPLSSF